MGPSGYNMEDDSQALPSSAGVEPDYGPVVRGGGIFHALLGMRWLASRDNLIDCTSIHSTDEHVLPLTLHLASDRPIYAQIVDQMALAIRSGQVSPGETLPSVRDIAARLAVNPNTVAKAYAQLETAGLVRGQPGRGYVAAAPRMVLSADELRRRLDDAVAPLVADAARHGWTRSDVIAALTRHFNEKDLP